MNKNIKIEDVLTSKKELPSAYVHVSDWFSVTWHCSHIRFLSVRTWRELELPSFLAFVFENDPSHPQLSVNEWLPNCTLSDVGKEKIDQWISHAKSDYDEEALQEESNVEGTQFPISHSATDDIKWAFEIKGQESPSNKHLAGPTYIVFWQNSEWLYYLEIHNES